MAEYPAWFVSQMDQEEASARDTFARNRARYEDSVRRHATSDQQVADEMAQFDQYRKEMLAAVDTATSEPASTAAAGSADTGSGRSADSVPRPRSHPTGQDSPSGADDTETARDTTPRRNSRNDTNDRDPLDQSRAKWAAHQAPPDPPAPGRATRVMHSPRVMLKALIIGLGIGLAVWTALSGLSVGLLDTAWWGWWPGLVTAPAAVCTFLWWSVTSFGEIRHWLYHGGREPLRPRVRH